MWKIANYIYCITYLFNNEETAAFTDNKPHKINKSENWTKTSMILEDITPLKM